jgi:hypothetical protein
VWAQRLRGCEVVPPDEYPWDPNLGGTFHPDTLDPVVEPGEVGL